MEEVKKMNMEELDKVAGGKHYYGVDSPGSEYEGPWRTVTGLESGYLAVRTYYEYNDNNIIGRLYNGNNVQQIEKHAKHGYVKVWAPTCGCEGWVNANYLK